MEGGASGGSNRLKPVPFALRAVQGRIRTEIVSPANEQYTIALRAFQIVPSGSISALRVPEAKDRSK